jgi:hypothetical protein
MVNKGISRSETREKEGRLRDEEMSGATSETTR